VTVPVGDWPRLPSPVRRVLSRIGRRGAYLITFGMVFVLLGLEPAEPSPVYAYVARLMPLVWWQWAFLVCGAVAVAAGSLLPPPKAIGFSALQLISVGWGGGILAAALDPAVPGVTAIRGGLLWLLVAISTQVVARLVEPSDLVALARHSAAGDHPAGEQRIPRRWRRGR